MLKVGYIGLGIMGRPCVLNLLRAGFPVAVWARHPERARQVLDAGATWCDSAAQLAGEVDVLITNLSDTPDVEQVLLGEDGCVQGARPGLVCVDMSTIAPFGARRIAEQLAAHGVDFLDCPVSGGEVGAVNGTLTIMVGGKESALERVRSVLAAMGQTITRIGDSGAGQVAKACNQIAVGVGVAMVAEVMKLARACGVDPVPVRQALLGGFAASRVLDVHGQRMIDDNYAPGFKASLHLKDMGIVLDCAHELGIELPQAERVTGLIKRLVEQGDGELDSAAIARFILNSETTPCE
ncbi:NAD(P)-dependent oxidoreductase [Paludibacterium purpuratum]|uniref:2-hydroxy-3-oxopropionate reductase n=1 Tax=Paludibacterium purpuratum TaxID=1144873 RepID=A0A4R7B3S3_9NEIS|nr:NAD(P)-dependent oxidoreductase [Paludibacterium purpuratum]TDR78446.1 2-hydroxy-3-oxopropionate reductase [Paludibacterium purpuratum]